LTQAVSVAVSVTERESLRNADLVLAPSLIGIGGTDYRHARELIDRGYQAAAQKQRFLATLALDDTEWAAYQDERRGRMKAVPAQASRLVAHSTDPSLSRYAQAELDRGPISLPSIEHQLSTFVASAALPGAFYRLSPEPNAPGQPQSIIAEVEPRSGSQLFVRPSLELAVSNGEPTRGSLRGFVTYLPQDAYRARYRVQFSIGYSPQLATEYDHPIATSQWSWSPSFSLLRQNSATYSGSQHFTHWQDSYSAAFDFGYAPDERLRFRAGLEAGYEQLSAVQFPGARPALDGAFLSARLRADWNSLDDPSLPTRGTLFEGSIAARYRHADGSTVPLAATSLDKHLAVLSGTFTTSLSAASSFGAALNYFDLFPLGGSTNLHGFRYQQFHAASYAMAGLAYRKPLREMKFLVLRPQFGVWYDVAGINQLLQRWQSAQSGSLGVLFNSPLGVVTFAVGRTSDNQTRAWINVGRP
jgi:hypothetical protein